MYIILTPTDTVVELKGRILSEYRCCDTAVKEQTFDEHPVD